EDREHNEAYYMNYSEEYLKQWHRGLAVIFHEELEKRPVKRVQYDWVGHTWAAYMMGVLSLSVSSKHLAYENEHKGFLQAEVPGQAARLFDTEVCCARLTSKFDLDA